MYLPIGTLLQGGRYKIVRFISSGGFGCTYEAEHVMLGNSVAVKEFFVKDFCDRDEGTGEVSLATRSKAELVNKLRKKFLEEARVVVKMHHPNIVRVMDVFEEKGTAYYVMDYIEGRSLHDMVKQRGALPEQEAVRYIRQVADALRYVHSLNRLHLDVKPGNIMVDEHDNAVLIDFGTSKQYDEVSGENTSTLMGKTPGYAPLEQMGNDVVEFFPSTDIYALGATLYKLLTGITPPSANLIASGDTPAPLPNTVSNNVASAISAAMRTKRLARPQSIDKFLAILDNAAPTPTPGEKTEYGGEVEVISFEPPAGTQTPQHDSTNTESNPTPPPSADVEKKSTLMPAILAAIVCAVIVIVVLGVWKPWAGSSTTDTGLTEGAIEEEEQTKTYKVTYGGATFTYTGPVNDKGLPEGKGTGVYSYGTYEGEYVNGSREGKGSFVSANGENSFDGTFKDNHYERGTLTYNDDGSYFFGTFKDGDPYTGVVYNKDGSTFCRYDEGKAI